MQCYQQAGGGANSYGFSAPNIFPDAAALSAVRPYQKRLLHHKGQQTSSGGLKLCGCSIFAGSNGSKRLILSPDPARADYERSFANTASDSSSSSSGSSRRNTVGPVTSEPDRTPSFVATRITESNSSNESSRIQGLQCELAKQRKEYSSNERDASWQSSRDAVAENVVRAASRSVSHHRLKQANDQDLSCSRNKTQQRAHTRPCVISYVFRTVSIFM